MSHDGILMTGPLNAFQAEPPELTVSVIRHENVPPGTPNGQVHVWENAQEFDVTYYAFEGYHGLYHERGQNWIVWTDDVRHVYVSRGPEEWARTWVYARFILRHFIVGRLVAQPGYRRIHAVAGSWAGGGSSQSGAPSGVLIAGPYLSGKTYLLQKLIERGVVAELVEDDCAVLDPEWNIHALLPVEHALRYARVLPINGFVCLDKSAPSIKPVSPEAAAQWVFPIQASWPLSWMVGGLVPETTVQTVPEALRCLKMPERPPIEQAIVAIRSLFDQADGKISVGVGSPPDGSGSIRNQ